MQTMTRWLNLSETRFCCARLRQSRLSRAHFYARSRDAFRRTPDPRFLSCMLSNGGQSADASETSRSAVPDWCRFGAARSCFHSQHPAHPRRMLMNQSSPKWQHFCESAARASLMPSGGNGPVDLVLLASAVNTALETCPDHPKHVDVGVSPAPGGPPAAFELRAFFTDHQGNVREDPSTAVSMPRRRNGCCPRAARRPLHCCAGNSVGPRAYSHSSG